MRADDAAPGWDAIDARLAAVHGDLSPQHLGTVVNWALGGPDPLDGVSAYPLVEPVPHWHLVGYGLSELYAKQDGSDRTVSGFGMELTMRVARAADDAVPIWAVNLLQSLARYMFRSGNRLGVGHHLDSNGPIARDHPTALRALTFAEDPQLGTIDTPHGSVAFVQAVGITLDERDAQKRWQSEPFLELLRGKVPLLVTDLARPSILIDPSMAAAVAEGVARDGSSTSELHVPGLGVDGGGGLRRRAPSVRFGATTLRSVQGLLAGRLGLGRPLLLLGDDVGVGLVAGSPTALAKQSELLWSLILDPAALAWLTALPVQAGRHRPPELAGVELVVEQSVIRDEAGNVVETIG